MKDLALFDQLAADITLLVKPTLAVTVTDNKTSEDAIEIAKRLKELKNRVEKKRKEIVGPINDQVKAINDYAKKILAPLDQADEHVRQQLNEYATQLEIARRAEQERIRKEQEAAEKAAAEQRERELEALRIQQEAEAESHVKAIDMFGAEDAEIAQANAEMQAKLEREYAEKQAEIERQQAIQKIEFEQQKYDAKQMNIANSREHLSVEVVDIDAVPKEFLIRTVNEKAVLAAYKAGVTIAGVRVKSEMRVAIGANTRAARR